MHYFMESYLKYQGGKTSGGLRVRRAENVWVKSARKRIGKNPSNITELLKSIMFLVMCDNNFCNLNSIESLQDKYFGL